MIWIWATPLREVRQAVHLVGEDIYPLLFPVKQADMDAQSTYQREENRLPWTGAAGFMRKCWQRVTACP